MKTKTSKNFLDTTSVLQQGRGKGSEGESLSCEKRERERERYYDKHA